MWRNWNIKRRFMDAGIGWPVFVAHSLHKYPSSVGDGRPRRTPPRKIADDRCAAPQTSSSCLHVIGGLSLIAIVRGPVGAGGDVVGNYRQDPTADPRSSDSSTGIADTHDSGTDTCRLRESCSFIIFYFGDSTHRWSRLFVKWTIGTVRVCVCVSVT